MTSGGETASLAGLLAWSAVIVVLGLIAAGPGSLLPFLATTGVAALLVVRLETRPGRDFGTQLDRGRVIYPVALVAACLIVGLPTLRCDFVSDDFGWLSLYGRKPLFEIFALADASRGVLGDRPDQLRPLFGLWVRIGFALFGSHAAGFHLANVALHTANCLLLYGIVMVLTGGRSWTAFVAGLAFGLAPANT